MDKLPIYRFKVSEEDDETAVTAVALVDNPAIELNWQTFSDSKQLFKADAEKRLISGPLMVADLPIYRRDEQGEYYGLFTAEDIYNVRNKFFRQENSKSVNMMHDPSQSVEGVYMVESFLIDSKRGIHSPNGYKLTDGSWFGTYKVDNQDVWENFIKSGEFRGFSVEGVFKQVQIDKKPLSKIEQIIEIVKQIED
jgi:hypothetical protein